MVWITAVLGFATSSAPQPESPPRLVLYVSKLGDNTTGRSWRSAFRTIQAALDAVPPNGGCRIIVRPDTYMEANLFPAHPGREGAYNELIGDTSGSYGGGRVGQVVLDCGDPERGFKSYDWWGSLRAYKKGWSAEHAGETFSAIGWDRWRFKNLYVTGGDGGLMFDCTDRVEPFSVVVENCVSIGRAFGGGVASCLSRPDEPITFRGCTLLALDWWGDTAAAYVRVENTAMPDRPDVVFEDCTMISPQCALKAGNYGYHTCSRVQLRRCKLFALNFSQPAGTPTDGIIQSVQHGKYLHVELEDCLLAGYKVFGSAVSKESADQIGRSLRGNVRAYVQFQQEVPPGMLRLGHWPLDALTGWAPPPRNAGQRHPLGESEPPRFIRKDMCEVSPIKWNGKLYLLECHRPASGGTQADYRLVIRDVAAGAEVASFGQGYSLASAFVWNGRVYVYASRFEDNNWNDVTVFWSNDLRKWEQRLAIRQEPNEHLFNSSVCRGSGHFVMAYETNDPRWPAFTIKFAVSHDLVNWTTVPGALLGTDRYAACPCVRYSSGWYYVLYLEQRSPRWYFETWIARSRDLKHWELSSANPVLEPFEMDDGINASDPDIVEFEGKTMLYYAVGDQRTWMNIKRADYPMGLRRWLEGWFRSEPVATR